MAGFIRVLQRMVREHLAPTNPEISAAASELLILSLDLVKNRFEKPPCIHIICPVSLERLLCLSYRGLNGSDQPVSNFSGKINQIKKLNLFTFTDHLEKSLTFALPFRDKFLI